MNIPLFYNIGKFYTWFALGGIFCKFATNINVATDIMFSGLGIVFTIIAMFYRSPFFVTIAAMGDLYIIYRFMPRKKNKTCCFFSKNSFGIYLLHSPLIYITFSYLRNSSPILVWGINFLFFGFLATVMTVLITRTRLSFVFGIR